MNALLRLYGWPHELLHALALVLIGRRPRGISRAHVDLPPDLGRRQFVFVALFPTLVFIAGGTLGLIVALNAGALAQLALGLLLSLAGLVGAAGGVGDWQAIALRLADEADER